MLDKSPVPAAVNVPNDLAAHWMPFTANRAFKKNPRLLAGAKDMYYFTVDGRKLIDAAAGMWCCNAGHGRSQIAEAIGKQAAALDYAPPFQFGIPQAFELASRIADLAPDGLDHVFFCNSGSEAADTALKIALAYHQTQGQGTRTRLIGRERGYHGVGFGGTSVGGIVGNRKMFGTLLAGVDHLPHTYDREKQAFAKGITNGAAPMGGVVVRDTIHDAFMSGPEHVVELTHGYTYSAHPLACAAGLATLDIYRDEKLFERAHQLEPKFAEAVMSLKKEPNVVDIRTVGLTAGIDLAPRPDLPGKRGFDGLNSAFHDNDLMLRVAGDTLALTPPLIVTEDQIGEIIEKVTKVIRAVA